METIEKAPAVHLEFLKKLRRMTESDERLLGIAVAGSLCEGAGDDFSDVDLQVVVTKSDVREILGNPLAFVEKFGKVLAFFSGEHVGEPRLVIVLYKDNLLHVDFKFLTLEEFGVGRIDDLEILWEKEGLLSRCLHTFPKMQPTADAQWIEDRFWVWVHYVAAKIGRGENMEALDGIAWLRREALAPMASLVLRKRNRRVRRLESESGPYYGDFVETVARSLDRKELKRALAACVTLYRKLRGDLSLSTLNQRKEAEAEVTLYLEAL